METSGVKEEAKGRWYNMFRRLADFVEYANDPVFGKEALNKSREDVKPKEREPHNKGKGPPKKPSYP